MVYPQLDYWAIVDFKFIIQLPTMLLIKTMIAHYRNIFLALIKMGISITLEPLFKPNLVTLMYCTLTTLPLTLLLPKRFLNRYTRRLKLQSKVM